MNVLKVFEGELSVQLLTAAILAILFLQSGLDKVFDWKGNLGWLQGHFAKSMLKSVVPILLFIITIFEIAAGLVSAIGLILLFTSGDTTFAMLGAQLAALSIVMLFFGQRIAKDYAGAATLVPYFILAIFGILILS